MTTWEPVYLRERWRAFPEGEGFAQVAPAAFAKLLLP